MGKKFQTFPGMDDVLPGEVEKWQWLEQGFRTFIEAQGYEEIRTPYLEPTELFSRSIGDASDIVHKEMYTFQDRGERSMTLRPENTASVVRSVIQNSLLRQAKPIRLYYIGPMFRAERPQAGRKRQFHQFGAELIGNPDRIADYEIIYVLYRFLEHAGIRNPKLRMNDLGETKDRERLVNELHAYFEKQKTKLCKDCHWRLEKNVLRILDCKSESCQPVIKNAPWDKIAPVSEGFQELLHLLEAKGIACEVDRRLVRGLDYYNGPVFEIAAEGLGAQDAVAGGGRYDHLFEQVGGPATPCTGFSLGVERLLMAIEKTNAEYLVSEIKKKTVYFAPFTQDGEKRMDARLQVFEMARELKKFGFRTRTGHVLKKIGDHLKVANKESYGYVVIIGPEELQEGQWMLKDMSSGEEQRVAKDDLLHKLIKERLGASTV